MSQSEKQQKVNQKQNVSITNVHCLLLVILHYKLEQPQIFSMRVSIFLLSIPILIVCILFNRFILTLVIHAFAIQLIKIANKKSKSQYLVPGELWQAKSGLKFCFVVRLQDPPTMT